MIQRNIRRNGLIFVLVGPELGFVGFCIAAAIHNGSRYMGLLFPGSLLLFPFIFALGFFPAFFIFIVDDTLTAWNSPRWIRAIVCCAFGALLSLGLFYVAPDPFPEVHTEGLANALPGGIAGLVCSIWCGCKKPNAIRT